MFDQFVNKYGIKGNIKKILDCHSGVIPYYHPKVKFQNNQNNIFLVGDSACMIKNTSSGGLLHGLKSASILADCINHGKEEYYRERVKNEISKDLKLHYYFRNVLKRFKNKDWEFLLDLIQNNNLQSVLEKYDRDYAKQIVFKVLRKEPRLLYFLKYMFYAFS